MRFRDFHINIKIRVLETFLSRMVGGMVFPFMAIYLASHFSAKVTGLMLLVNVVIGASVNFLGGYIADKYGRKKIMAFAEVLRFLAFAMMALANSPWLELPVLTYLMMTVNSICWGLAGPANQAMLIDVSTPEQRKLMYSITYWASNLSIAVGGIIGGIFFKEYLFELFTAVAFSAFIIALMVLFLIKESYVPKEVDAKTSFSPVEMFRSYKTVIQDKLFVLFIISHLLIISLEMNLTNYIGIRLSNEMPVQSFFNWNIDGVAMLGILRTENTILVALTSLFAVKLISSYKDRNVILVGSTTFVLGYAIIAYSSNIWLLFICMILATVGEVIRVPVEQSYLASIPPDDQRSSYMALNGLTFNGSMMIASLFVTLSAFLSSIWMALLALAVGLAGIAILIKIIPGLEERRALRERQHSQSA
ncbi:MFS transporter [Bacillus sp. BGMRC 2118]|nr:MFS transporter [Bacillus sp. BGMRC 2118]